MKMFLTLALMTISAVSLAQETSLQETLESKLTFSGAVDIEAVTTIDAYSVVEFYVSAYGEERLTSCVFRYDVLKDCKDNWFDL